ncbi:CD3072 family TudS-related putative desulfidase [candidate division KSB1 bacterium]
MNDKRSGKIVVLSHCMLNVHCLEENLAIYPGAEEEIIKLLLKKGVGIFQILCPEIELSGIFRKPLPRESYDKKKVRQFYRELSEKITKTLLKYIKKDYEITAVLGAEGSPTCGIGTVGKWKENVQGKREFPRDIEFIDGMGVFMEELKSVLLENDINPEWIGIPGKSLRTIKPESFKETLQKLDDLL